MMFGLLNKRKNKTQEYSDNLYYINLDSYNYHQVLCTIQDYLQKNKSGSFDLSNDLSQTEIYRVYIQFHVWGHLTRLINISGRMILCIESL